MYSATGPSNKLSIKNGNCERIQSDVFSPSLSAEVFTDPYVFIKFVKSCHGSRYAQDEIAQLKESRNYSYVFILISRSRSE